MSILTSNFVTTYISFCVLRVEHTVDGCVKFNTLDNKNVVLIDEYPCRVMISQKKLRAS